MQSDRNKTLILRGWCSAMFGIALFLSVTTGGSVIIGILLALMLIWFSSLAAVRIRPGHLEYRRFVRWNPLPFSEVVSAHTVWPNMVGRVTLKKAVRPWRDLYFVLDRDRKVVSFLDHVSGAGAAPDGVTEALRPSAMLRSKDWIYILIPFASGIAIQSVSFVAFLFFGSGATVSPDAEWIPIRVFTIVNELIVSKALTAIFALLIVLIAARTLQVWRMAAMVAFVLGAIIASRIFSLSF